MPDAGDAFGSFAEAHRAAVARPRRRRTRIAVIGSTAASRAVLAWLGHGAAARRYQVVGGGIEPLLRNPLAVDAVLVAQADRAGELCRQLRNLPVDVWVTPELAGGAGVRRDLGGRFVVELWGRPLRRWRGVLKRAEDLVLALPLLMVALPVLLAAAIAIRLDSPGPMLLRQRRFGYANRPFEVLKLRTMRYDPADVSGARPAVKGDPRITRIGRFLRASSIDELPQLINVLKGEMSLVGPRAHPVTMQVNGVPYEQAVPSYPARHRMRPGITGLAQVSGLRGLVDTQEKAERRVEYDLRYVDGWSLGLDLRILWATLWRGFVDGSAF